MWVMVIVHWIWLILVLLSQRLSKLIHNKHDHNEEISSIFTSYIDGL